MFIEKEYKSIINKKKWIDSWFWERYSINPYNGCHFGCIYCDARSGKYHMPEQFEEEIVVKKNVAQMLDMRLTRARTFQPDIVGIGGVTDCYQPAEKIYKNTQQILEVLLKHQFPVHICTKSDLVLRDLDLLQAIARLTWASVSVTILTVDKERAKFLDYRAPSPQRRLKVIQTIKEKAPQVQTGVLAIPVIPFLTEDTDQLENLFQKVKAAGADYLLFGFGVTLRDRQALWFLRKLKEKFSELIPEYEQLYGFKYNPQNYSGTYGPDLDYQISKHQILFELSEKYQLPFRIKRFIPNDFRALNYKITERLFEEAYIRQLLGNEYQNYLWAGQHIQNLNESIWEIEKRGTLGEIRNVKGEIREKVLAWMEEEVS